MSTAGRFIRRQLISARFSRSPNADPTNLRMRGRYTIPGLAGVWRLMGLSTTGMGADGKAELHMIREDES